MRTIHTCDLFTPMGPAALEGVASQAFPRSVKNAFLIPTGSPLDDPRCISRRRGGQCYNYWGVAGNLVVYALLIRRKYPYVRARKKESHTKRDWLGKLGGEKQRRRNII